MLKLKQCIVKNFIKVSIFVTFFSFINLSHAYGEPFSFKGKLSKITGAYCVKNQGDKCILSGASCEIKLLNLQDQGSIKRAKIQLVVNGVESEILTLPGRPYIGEFEYDYSSDLDRVSKGDQENYEIISDNFIIEIIKSYFPETAIEIFESTPIRLLFGMRNNQAILTGVVNDQGGGLFANGKFGHFICKGTIVR